MPRPSLLILLGLALAAAPVAADEILRVANPGHPASLDRMANR
jgi:hypothetical protein